MRVIDLPCAETTRLEREDARAPGRCAGTPGSRGAGRPRSHAPEPGGLDQPLYGGLHSDAAILLVEDHEVNRLVAQGLLAALGYARVTTAVHGLDALAACERERFDLVLMDCQMPEMDGLQATAEMRRRGLRMPVLALTAHAVVGDRERCLQAGMDDYMTKPVEPRLLADKLQRWLGGAPQAQPAAAPVADSEAAFDRSTLVERFLGDRQLFARAREIFLQHTGGCLRDLAAALARDDLAAARAVAHRVKGSAATIGAPRLARLCNEIETGCPPGGSDSGRWLAVAVAALDAFAAASAMA